MLERILVVVAGLCPPHLLTRHPRSRRVRASVWWTLRVHQQGTLEPRFLPQVLCACPLSLGPFQVVPDHPLTAARCQ